MDFSRYATASQRLRQYAELNKDDCEFDRRKGEIVYIFDTSVLESYWRRDPTGTSGRYGTDDLLTSRAATYSGWLALKYLIEHRLPGQKREGFLSPSHWNEALDRVHRLETDARRSMRSNFDGQEIDAALKFLSRFVDDPERLLKEAERLSVGKLFTNIMRAVSEAERVRRVFITGRNGAPSVRDLNACSYYWDPPGPKVRHQDFKRWHSRISHHRNILDQARGKAPPHATRNIENDAITMASIQSMYRGNAGATDSRSASVRFVFVTADIAIHEAYIEIQDSLEKEGIPFFLRHPHVYAPLLNHVNMSQGGLSKDQSSALKVVFNRVEQALEPLFYNHDLRSRLIQGYDRKLTYNVELWSSNVETICLANSHYILSDTSGEYVTADALARILSAPDVREAAAHSVSEDIGRIRNSHLQVMSLITLESLAKTQRAMKDAPNAGDHRAPVKLIDVDIAGELGYPIHRGRGTSAWIDSLLERFKRSQADQSPEEVLERVRKAWDNPRSAAAAQLLAACIFFAANEWEPARLCAELCQGQIKGKRYRNVWLREAGYCEALAIRMQLRSKADVERAIDILTNNIADHGDSLSAVRDRVERASLILTAAVFQTVEDQTHVDSVGEYFDLINRNSIQSRYSNAIADLELSIRRISELDTLGAPDRDTRTRIQFQAEINMLGAAVFAHVFGWKDLENAIEIESIRAAKDSLVAFMAKEKVASPHTASLYIVVADAIIDGGQDAMFGALSTISRWSGHEVGLSIPDLRELDFLRKYLSRLAGVSA